MNASTELKNLKHTLLGILGERIIAKLLRHHGHAVDESLDMFDSIMDMQVDGKPVEVKTLVPLLIHNSFAVNINQYEKIKNADKVYWISVPPSKITDELSGCIFEMDPKIAKHFTYKLKNGRELMCFKRKQDGMKIIKRLRNKKLLNHLQKLSTSYL